MIAEYKKDVQLFLKGSMQEIIKEKQDLVLSEIKKISAEDIVHRPDEIVSEVCEKLSIKVPEFIEDKISMEDPDEAEIDILLTDDSTRSELGVLIVVHMPFAGHKEVFDCAPKQLRAVNQKASIKHNELTKNWTAKTFEALSDIDDEIMQFVNAIKSILEYLSSEARVANNNLGDQIKRAVYARKKVIEQKANFLAGLTTPLYIKEEG